MNIYVSNLGFNVQREELQEKFSLYGDVNVINIIIDKISNSNRGHAFVSMPSRAAGENAIRELNGYMLDGHSIKVKESRATNEESRNNFY